MIEALRKTARYGRFATLAGLRAIGCLERFAASEHRRRRLLILCYHGVSMRDEHDWDPELFVTPAFLRRRFEILRDGGYRVLPLAEAVRCLQSHSLPARSVALTFDDGFYNFFAAAAPLLEEFNYPATVYVTSYFCVHQRPILALTIRYLLWRARPQVLAPGVFAGHGNRINLQDAKQRDDLAASLLDQAKVFSGDREARQAWLGRIAERLGIDWEDILQSRLFHLMTTTEVADISRRGIDVQLHTHRHRTPRNELAFRAEVQDNRCILEELTGRQAVHFCYPSGDHDPMFLPWLRDLGVETATTCAVGLAKADDNSLLLPRYIDTMAQSEVLFESWLAGVAEMLSRGNG